MANLEIRLLGALRVRRDGEDLPLPPSRKTRALLAYLALQGTPQRRDDLCDIFWEVPDDPRGALRWSLAKLRPLVNERGAERIVADRERVAWASESASVDILEVRSTVQAGLQHLDDRSLTELDTRFDGRPLAGLELPNHPTFENWRMSQVEACRRLHLRILDERLARAAGDPAASISILRRRLDVDPADEAAHAALIEGLQAHGDRPGAERQLALSRRALAALGAGGVGGLDTVLRGESPLGSSVLRGALDCDDVPTSGNVHVAYARIGESVRNLLCRLNELLELIEDENLRPRPTSRAAGPSPVRRLIETPRLRPR